MTKVKETSKYTPVSLRARVMKVLSWQIFRVKGASSVTNVIGYELLNNLTAEELDSLSDITKFYLSDVQALLGVHRKVAEDLEFALRNLSPALSTDLKRIQERRIGNDRA